MRETPITPESLIVVGFKPDIWEDEGEVFADFTFFMPKGSASVNVSFEGRKMVRIEMGNEADFYIKLPGVRTIEDLKTLLRFLGKGETNAD